MPRNFSGLPISAFSGASFLPGPETMKPACDYSAKKGVILGLESHGGITSKASNILEILHRIDSPYAGCNLDISNFREKPYEQIQACLPVATHIHIRDFYG